MSDPICGPESTPDLQFEKKQAKSLLKAFRVGDLEATTRMRSHLPRLAQAAADAATLADAQFVIARERGFSSWPKLKVDIESKLPLKEQVERFVRAVCGEQWSTAERMLKQHPGIATYDIHAACVAANARAVEQFLNRDPSLLDAKRWGHWPPLLFACASRMHLVGPQLEAASERCVRLLLDRGADPNTYKLADVEDPNSRLPALFFACTNNNPRAAKLLLERGAAANDGESLYHTASLNHRECLEILRTHGAELSARHPHWQNTPLYFVVTAQGNHEGLRWLLENGSDPNVTSSDKNETPLHAAASNGNLEAIDLLLAHDADPSRLRSDGKSCYALAIRNGDDRILKRLQAANATKAGVTAIDELIGACMRCDEAEARRIVNAAPNLVETFTPEDRSILAHAAHLDRIDALQIMAGIGFDLSWESTDGGTALHWAAWWGRVESAKLLVEWKAPINVRDRTYGSSPIAFAAHGSSNCRRADDDYCAIVDTLIDAGADYAPSINRWNERAEHMASRRVRARMIERGFVPAASAPADDDGDTEDEED
jgi:ankyrin repeat protein